MSNGIGRPIGTDAGLCVGAWIQHRVLTMVWEVDGRKHPRFRVAKSIHVPTTEDIKGYVKRVINDQILEPLIGPTPWDIDLPNFTAEADNHPRVMVLQLSREFQWEFSQGTPGIDAKEDWPGEDCDLHYVDANGVATLATPAGPPAGCRMLYWSVLSRPKGHKGRGFNFYITLIDPESGHGMPTIFDPSIPDNGSGSIP